ncbi:hypothetical protein GCM10011297_23190 [Bacterioplanes sanyensis]|uniref:hypothetical protein n=1 Tax=Bacterioplanes sanyensis TaxID=1249553 RepID=UPI001676D4B7|nr:hypothetical protein [Bacterioplanes sanyensis]GGY49589.1 hypothetical protein GCM10011297_23190 [Bacterioplanes sanyensis]
MRIVRRHASPDTPKLGHRIGEDGKVEIFEITDNIDFAARPIDTQKISVNDIRDPELDRLERHRERLNMLIDQRYKNGELDKVAELQKKRIAQSEKIGEAVARKHFNNLGYEEVDLPNDLMGNGKQGTFDMVYRDKDGNLVIVEAKGGNSQLGSRKLKYGKNKDSRAQQGTKEYMDDIIANYEAKLGSENSFVKELKKANRRGNIRYTAVRQPLTKDGSLTGQYKVDEFKIK